MIIKRKLRYVLVECSRDFDPASEGRGLEKELLRVMGEHSFADANPRFVDRCRGNAFVVSVNRGTERNAILALAFVKNIGGQDVGFYSIRTSGTMRKLLSDAKKLYA